MFRMLQRLPDATLPRKNKRTNNLRRVPGKKTKNQVSGNTIYDEKENHKKPSFLVYKEDFLKISLKINVQYKNFLVSYLETINVLSCICDYLR